MIMHFLKISALSIFIVIPIQFSLAQAKPASSGEATFSQATTEIAQNIVDKGTSAQVIIPGFPSITVPIYLCGSAVVYPVESPQIANCVACAKTSVSACMACCAWAYNNNIILKGRCANTCTGTILP